MHAHINKITTCTVRSGAMTADVERTRDESSEGAEPRRLGWKELYLKEDWWAVWLGFALMALAILLFQAGDSNVLKALAINPGGLKWTSLGQLADHFAHNAHL